MSHNVRRCPQRAPSHPAQGGRAPAGRASVASSSRGSGSNPEGSARIAEGTDSKVCNFSLDSLKESDHVNGVSYIGLEADVKHIDFIIDSGANYHYVAGDPTAL